MLLANKLPRTRSRLRTAIIQRWLGVRANTADDELPTGAGTKDSKAFILEDELLKNQRGTSKFANAETGRVGGLGWFPNSTVNTYVKQNGTKVYVYIESQDSFIEIPSTRTTVTHTNFVVFQNFCFVMDGVNNLGLIQPQAVTFASAPTAGDTSEDLAANWTGTSGDYPVVFSTGEYRLCTLTNGAVSCTWTGALPAGTYATTGNYTFDYSTPSTGIANFAPKFGRIRNNQMYVAGYAASPTTFYYSDVATDAAPENIYNYSTGNSGNNILDYEIKGMAMVGDDVQNQTLILSTAGGGIGISSINETTFAPNINHLASVPPFNHERLVSEGDGLGVYLSSSLKFRLLSSAGGRVGTENRDLSDKIDNLMLTLATDQTNANAFYFAPRRWHVFQLVQKGFTEPNLEIIYDLKTEEFFTRPRSAYSVGMMDKLNNKGYVGDAFSGQVYQYDEGFAEKGTQSIDFEFNSNKETLGAPGFRKEFREIRFTGRRSKGTTIDFEAYVDGILAGSYQVSDTSPQAVGITTGGIGGLGIGGGVVGGAIQGEPETVQTPFRVLLKIRSKGYNLQIRIKNSGTAQLFEVSRGTRIGYVPIEYDPTTIKS